MIDHELLLPLLFLAAGLCAVALLAIFARRRSLVRTLRGIPEVAIATARDGERVKIVGQLRFAGSSLVAPLSKRACALYRVRIVEMGSDVRVRDLSTAVDFFSEDDTGRALIRPNAARIESFDTILVNDRTARTQAFGRDDREALALLVEQGIDHSGLKDIKITEGVFEEGERVAAWGLAHWEADPGGVNADYRSAPRQLVLSSSDDYKIILSDDPTLTRAPKALLPNER